MHKRLIAFFRTETAGGLIMIAAAACALIAANSPAAAWYLSTTQPLALWVNDILMVLFFLLIGMELKKEMVAGVLADKKQILLPMVAAIGGMAAPALLFLLINKELPAHWNGWAIASATDIAFAVCILTLVAKSAPPAMKIFLLAIAIFDDLGAILIIALFYNHDLALLPLLASGGIIGLFFLLNRLRVTSILPFIFLGIALWFGLHAGGIHTTLAGVITGLFIPMKRLDWFMHKLHPWVAFFILPLFAFVMAGVSFSGLNIDSLIAPLPLSVTMGLFCGKQIGIFGASWLLIRGGFAQLPAGTSWGQVYGVSVIAGIGFTMSLFIGMLAFSDATLQEQVKIGVMAGSLLASAWGWVVLREKR